MKPRNTSFCLLLLLGLSQSTAFAQTPATQSIKDRINAVSTLEEKERYLDSLHLVFAQNEVDSVLINDVYYQIGYQFQRIEFWEKAISAYKKATFFAQEDDLLNGKSNWKLGKTWSELKKQDSAIFYLKLAIERLPDSSKYRPNAYRDIGDAYQEKGDYQQAQFYMKEAIAQYESAGRASNVAHVMNSLGTLYYDFENYDSSLFYLRQAESIFLELNNDLSLLLINDVWINTGNVYLKREEWDKSQQYYQKVLSAAAKENNQVLISQENLAIIHRKKQEYQTAFTYLNKVLTSKKAFFKTDTHPDFASIYDNLGDVYFEQNNYKTAVHFYELAIAQVTKWEEHSTAISNARILGPTAELLNFLASKAKTLARLGKHQAALTTYQTADQLIDLMRYEHTEDVSKLFWRKTTRPLYEAAIQTAYELGDVAAAFYFIEKSKAVLLSDALNERLAQENANIPKEIIAEIKQLQRELTKANREKQRSTYLEKKEALGLLIAALEKEYPAYHQFKYRKELATLETVQQEMVNDSTAFVAYFVGDSVLYSVQIEQEKSEIARLPYQKSDFEVAEQLLSLAADPFLIERVDWDTFLLKNRQISALLLPTLGTAPKPKTNLIISPDAWLSYLNFELLLAPYAIKETGKKAASPPFLIKKHSFNYVYSATVLRYAKIKKARADHQFLGIAPIIFSKLPHLDDSQRQLSAIHRHISGECLVGKNANTLELLNKLEDRWRILHFVTHAEADSTTPYIALASQHLFITELYQLNLSGTELATLSACQSSIGKWREGEGVMSLARALTYAGASSVVASQWRIEEKATGELMADFYAHIAAGLPKDIALRKAKLAQLNQGAPPANWAAFISIGSAEPIVGLDGGGWWWIWVVGFIVVGTALYGIQGKSFKKKQNLTF